MRIVVTGAAGFIGGRLAAALAAAKTLDGRAIEEILLVDRAFPQPPGDPRVRHLAGDLLDPAIRAEVFSRKVDGFFHLAATLTAQAEQDFDQGLAMNLRGLLELLEDCRQQSGMRLVFASSMATFGQPFPDVVPDEYPQRPGNSYGVQKAIAELLLDDFTRRGFLDGRALRLPVVLIRPLGAAPALSEHISAVAREPLAGRPVNCPFAVGTRMPVVSVGAVARGLIRLFELPDAALGAVRSLNLPALTVTFADMLDAVARRAGPQARGLVSWNADPQLQRLLSGMPAGFTSARALAAGIRPEASFDAVIEDFLGHPH